MKKLINLITLVMLVSTNVLTPFSYAQEDVPELIPENEVEMVSEDTGEYEKILENNENTLESSEKTPENNEETPKNNEATPEINLEDKEELEQGKQEEELPENVLPDAQDDVKTPTIDENKIEDIEKVESDEVVQPMEEKTESEMQDEYLERREVEGNTEKGEQEKDGKRFRGDEMEEDYSLQKVEEPTIMEVISGTTATLLPGQQFNSVIKTLANGGVEVPYTGVDNNIQSFQRVDEIPQGVITREISLAGEEHPVYAWFDEGILYYYTKAEAIKMNENSQVMFRNFGALIELDLSDWNTRNVTGMQAMFQGCSKLENLNLDNWTILNDVGTISQMFYGANNLKTISMKNWTIPETFTHAIGCRASSLCADTLEYIDVSNWDLSKTKNLQGVFASLNAREIRGLETLNTSNITNMSQMFQYSINLTGLNVSSWDTSNVTNMSQMFEGCRSLTSLDLSNLSFDNVTTVSSMFADCIELKDVNLSGINPKKLSNIRGMFGNCEKLEKLDMSNSDFSNVNFEYFVGNSGIGAFSNNLKSLNLSYSIFSGSMSFAFNGLQGLEKVILKGINTTNVTNMTRLFASCSNLTGIDLSDFDTSNVTSMNFILAENTKLKNVNMDGLDLRKLGNNENGFFMGDNALEYVSCKGWKIPEKFGFFIADWRGSNTSSVVIDVTDWDLSNARDLSYLFGIGYGQGNAKFIGLDTRDTSGVTNMGYMFYNMYGLTGIDLSNWSTSNVINMNNMFYNCNSLEELNLSGWDFRKVSNSSLMKNLGNSYNSSSSSYPSLKKLNLTNTKYSGDMSSAFENLPNLEEVIMKGVDTQNVVNISKMFNGDAKLTEMDLSSFDTSNVTGMSQIFGGCSHLEEINLSGWDFRKYNVSALMMNMTWGGLPLLKKINMTNTKYGTTMNYAFGGLLKLEEIILNGVDTSNVVDMQATFNGDSSLINLDLSDFDTSNVTNMGNMFGSCSNLEELDLSSFETSRVTNMLGIFGGCNKLEEINMSGWDFIKYNTSSLMMSMTYGGIPALKKLNMTNTKYTGNQTYAFGGLDKLEELNLNGADTRGVTNMSQMFYNCSGLNELDLTSFDTSKVTNMTSMFFNIPNLKTIYASDKFVTTALSGDNSSKDMFSGTISVIGGNGTKFDSGYIDKTYAQIDKVGQTGYFTDKNAITVKFINILDGTESISTFAKGQKLTPPSVNGYHVAGGYLDEEMTQAIDLNKGVDSYSVIYIKYERNGSSGGGGGGGSKSSDTQDSSTSSQNDKSVSSGSTAKDPVIETPMDSSDKSSEGQEILSPSDSPSSAGQVSFTNEQKNAYTFAKENGITTKDTIQSAQMNGKLTRIAMAKMLSQYAINVLGKDPDISKGVVKFKDVTDKRNADYDNGVTLAYQLGIMGQNMKNNKFRPDDEVTRAEFVTALSRLLYSTSDGEYKSTSKYYTHHMEKLVNEGIITKSDPKMKERRGYVMIMLMRSAK